MSIYGLKLHAFGQSTFFSTEETLTVGDKVIVQEEERLCLGQVTSGPFMQLACVEEDLLPGIVRRVQDEDLVQEAENERLALDANDFCRACIAERALEMKLVSVEVFFDQSKIIFFFTAPTRIDFRELVKDLVRRYHTRIELRQIGVRHETQMTGAIGNCGMICCCKRYLRKFAPVTIRMAKEQNLFLNPSKISGSCGRLLCCLSYEQENYDNFFSQSPRSGKKYQTKEGVLRVVRTNMFRNTVSALDEAGEEREMSLEDWLNTSPERLDIPSQSDMDFLPDEVSYLDGDLPGEPACGFTLSGSDPDFDADLPDFDEENDVYDSSFDLVPKQAQGKGRENGSAPGKRPGLFPRRERTYRGGPSQYEPREMEGEDFPLRAPQGRNQPPRDPRKAPPNALKEGASEIREEIREGGQKGRERARSASAEHRGGPHAARENRKEAPKETHQEKRKVWPKGGNESRKEGLRKDASKHREAVKRKAEHQEDHRLTDHRLADQRSADAHRHPRKEPRPERHEQTSVREKGAPVQEGQAESTKRTMKKKKRKTRA